MSLRNQSTTPRVGTQSTNRNRMRSSLTNDERKTGAESRASRQPVRGGDDAFITQTARGDGSSLRTGDLTSRSSIFGASTDRLSELTSSRGDATTRAENDDVDQVDPTKTDEIDLPFFKQDPFADVVLQVGGKKLFTCRALLAYNSPKMAKILGSSSKNRELDLPEKSLDDVIELLAYIDPRVDYIITEQSAMALLPLAEEYEISALKRLCEQTIIQSFRQTRKGKRPGSLPVEISLEYLQMADKYNLPALRTQVTDELVSNEDPNATRMLLQSTVISENVKLMVLDKKVEKVHFELDKERRERTAIETRLGDYGNRRIRRHLQN